MKENGVSFLTVLGLIFIVLKLVGSITWSWWLVLMPFWIIPVFFVSIFIFVFLVALVFSK